MSDLQFEELLRIERNRIWNDCAAAAKTNTQSPQVICERWSLAADQILSKTFQHCFPQQDVALFALGKLGSSELNLSSDVDLLIVSLESSVSHMASLRLFQRLLSDYTSQGFVFRVDFDLRPGGRQGPHIPTLDQLKDYYGNYGETWERLAFVRLRGICGCSNILDQVQTFARKFSFRKHLDFTLLDDLKHLRSKIQDHYSARTQNHVVDLKLGIGGIRDVELFTHAMQVIHGGRDPSLQLKGTTAALNLLAVKKLLPEAEVIFLSKHYWDLRILENYVQALNDEQTHLLSLQESYPQFIQDLVENLKQQMQRCEEIVHDLLGEASGPVNLDSELKSEGFDESEIQEIWLEIVDQTALSRNKDRDENSRKIFLLEFLQTLKSQKGDPHKGMRHLKDFIQSTRAKASFFSLLLREKKLQQELAWLFGHSPYLSKIICSRPELLDSFVYRSQDRYSSDLSALLEELAEKRLLSEIINGSAYIRDQGLLSLTRNLTSTADEITSTLLSALKKDFPSEVEILALGKWGGDEMGLRSDLDFIFVTPEAPNENDYKLVRRFVTRLTEPHRGGRIYSIDMRLRPTGKAGPLVISKKDLEEYLLNESAAWERQAYLKARWIGQTNLDLQKAFINRGLSQIDLEKLNQIRIQLQQPALFNLKYNEGGMVDIELAAQAACLQQKYWPNSTRAEDLFSVWKQNKTEIQTGYERLRQIVQMLQLVASESLAEVRPKTELFRSLAASLQKDSEDLEIELRTLLSVNSSLLMKLDPRRWSH